MLNVFCWYFAWRYSGDWFQELYLLSKDKKGKEEKIVLTGFDNVSRYRSFWGRVAHRRPVAPCSASRFELTLMSLDRRQVRYPVMRGIRWARIESKSLKSNRGIGMAWNGEGVETHRFRHRTLEVAQRRQSDSATFRNQLKSAHDCFYQFKGQRKCLFTALLTAIYRKCILICASQVHKVRGKAC